MKRNINAVVCINPGSLDSPQYSSPSINPRMATMKLIQPNPFADLQRSGNLLRGSLLLLLFMLVSSIQVRAQDEDKKIRFLIEPYFLAPTMKGNIGIRELPAVEVDADPGDIFGQLKFGAMAYIEVNYDDKFSVTTDFLVMRLEDDLKPTASVGGTSTAKQLVFEWAGLVRVAPWLEVGAGGRVMDMKVDLDLNTMNGPRSAESRKTWMDPIIIVRSQGTVYEKLLLQFRGDIGGFGLASDFTWQIQANVGYKFSKLLSATIGYRVLDVNYDKGSGDERFMYDIATSGPVLRVGFTWK
ncbi:MAG TPA: hypothetical protein VK658_04135 [Chryseolinea sp.]|nr:hypothetical protein [Chryseolinea sp.]